MTEAPQLTPKTHRIIYEWMMVSCLSVWWMVEKWLPRGDEEETPFIAPSDSVLSAKLVKVSAKNNKRDPLNPRSASWICTTRRIVNDPPSQGGSFRRLLLICYDGLLDCGFFADGVFGRLAAVNCGIIDILWPIFAFNLHGNRTNQKELSWTGRNTFSWLL